MTESQAKVYGLVGKSSNSWKSPNPNSGCYEADTARTLDTNGGDATCNQGGNIVVYPEKARTLTARADSSPTIDRGQNIVVYENHQQEAIQPQNTRYIVRRLTPLECCHLQGYPDHWAQDLETPEPTESDIDEWSAIFETHRQATNPDKKQKTRNQVRKWLTSPHSDSAEYKMWGNSLAIPCAYTVLAGIAEEIREEEEICHMRNKIATNPIIDWSDEEIWDYIERNGITTNPLYAQGFKRVGCIGCPMAGEKGQLREFEVFPKYRTLYVRAFEKMLEYRNRRGYWKWTLIEYPLSKLKYSIYPHILGAIGKATRRKCGGCFRCNEPPEWSKKTLPRCSSVTQCGFTDEITTAHKCGKDYYPRWVWNAEQGAYAARIWVRDFFNKRIRSPINSRREAVTIEWNGEPRCPRCGEMPYSLEQCVF